MTGKNRSNTWDDIKMLIVTVAVTLMLGLWNVFAATGQNDPVLSENPPDVQANTPESVFSQESPAPEFIGKILMGGTAPQTRVIVRSNGGGGGGPVTQTRSS